MHERIDFVWSTPKDFASLKTLYEYAHSVRRWNCSLVNVPKPNLFNRSTFSGFSDTVIIAFDNPLRRLKKAGWKGRFMYIEHGLSPVKYYTYKYDFFYEAALLFYPGEIFKRKMASCNPAFDRGLLGGYPKCDELIKMSINRTESAQKFKLNPAEPVILFAPSWGGRQGAGISNIRHFRNISNVVSVPHPSDYKRAKKYGALIPPEHANINELIHLADIVVSDVSSVVAEAALIGKPTIQLELPSYPGCFPAPEKRKSGTWLSKEVLDYENKNTDRSIRPFKIPYVDEDWDFGFTCKPEDLSATIAQALKEPDTYKDKRRYWADQSCYKGDGHCSARIALMIEYFLETGSIKQIDTIDTQEKGKP